MSLSRALAALPVPLPADAEALWLRRSCGAARKALTA